MKQYYASNGKLLLTGEYLVLHGALALAIPLRLGQSMTVEAIQPENHLIQWNAYNPNGKWFTSSLKNDTLEILTSDSPSKAEKLRDILSALRELNPIVFDQSLSFETHLDFNPAWGLGSSSTLIANLARWAQVNPYELLKKTLGGSGYDIACATATTPIFYRLEMDQPVTAPAYFKPLFANNLYFVYQGQKQHSSKEVAAFNERARHQDFHEAMDEVSNISRKLPSVNNFDEFCDLIQQHEAILSRCLDREPVQSHFPDFEGTMKSLGAWGGDFVLVATRWPEIQVKDFFHQKGLDIIFKYDDIVYQ
jgi:mevalonate kinase